MQQALPRLLRRDWQRKELFDIFFSLLVLCSVCSWLLPLLALAIALDSRGPVLFRQLRTGKNGIPFYCLKLRTMYVSEDADRRQATRGDSRITRVGAFLRRTSLDELPQFINVLRGDMSVVGPRPHMLAHTERYNSDIDGFHERHLVKPGITGLAQVTGHRGDTSTTFAMRERFLADMRYLYNWSFRRDLLIVLCTVFPDKNSRSQAF